MREDDEEIREIKKEIIESRGLIIKTNNLTNSLASDIKSIAKRQAGYERRFNWNSAVAYILFATLSFVGLKLASDARIREIESDKAGLERRLEETKRELNKETRRAEQRAQAAERAASYYQLIRQQKRKKVVSQYESILEEELSPAEEAFFRDKVEQFRLDLSISAYQKGLDLMRTGRYAEAAQKLRKAIELKEEAAHMPSVKYQLAKALKQLGRQSEAMIYAQQVVDQEIDKDLHDNAYWLLARCANQGGDLDTARDALRTLLRRWPRSSIAPNARAKLRALNRKARRRK
jgi:TolA-binding protein